MLGASAPDWQHAGPAAAAAAGTAAGASPAAAGTPASSAQAEQLTLAGATDASYTLPPAALLRPGTRAEGADPGQRRDGRGAVGGA